MRVQPGHPDGSNGLKPLGDLYFYNSMVLGFPLVYLVVWWFVLIFPIFDGRYEYWRDAYLSLSLPAALFVVLSFVVPIWPFHREMQAQKACLLREADNLSQYILAIKSEIATAQSEADIKVLQARLAQWTQWYATIEHLPTWPVGAATGRLFTFNNLAVLLPLLSKLLPMSDAMKKVLDTAPGVLQGGG